MPPKIAAVPPKIAAVPPKIAAVRLYILLPKWFERLAERAYDGMMGVFGRQSTPRVTQVHQSFNWKEYPDGPPTSNINSKRLKDVLMEVAGPPTTHDPILSKIFDNLYRTDGKVGNGSTAAATRHELATGDKVEGKYHVKKAQQRIVNLQKWVRKNPNARSSDTRAAEDAISDLQNALKFGREIDGIPVKSQIRQQPRARASDAQRIREIRELIDYQKRREELSRWMRRF